MRHILINLMLRSASLISSVLLVIGVTTQLSSGGQGIFYYLQSLAALSFFFDLGVGFVLAHLAGNARHKRGRADGSHQAENWDEISAVAHFGLKWLLCAAILYTIVVSSIGLSGLGKVVGLSGSDVFLWALLVAANAGNIILSNALSFFEGLGYASKTSLPRFAQAFLNAALFFGLVTQEPDPYSIGISMAVSVLCAATISLLILREPIRSITSAKHASSIPWKTDVLPFQWRIAVSWLTGYFMFQAPTLAIASAGKLDDAGRFGLSMQIFLAIISVAQVYLTFGIVRWAGYFGQKRPKLAYREYLVSLAATATIVLVSGIGLIIAVEFILPAQLAERVLEQRQLILLLAGTLGFQLFMCSNFYFRAQLEERLWSISILGGLMMVLGWWRLGTSIDAFSASTLYCVVGLILGTSAIVMTIFDAQRQTRLR